MPPQSVGYNLCLEVYLKCNHIDASESVLRTTPPPRNRRRRKAGISSLTHAAATQVDTSLAC